MSLSNLKISKKLGLSFGAILFVVIGLSGVVWSHLRTIDAATYETNESYEAIAGVDRAAADLLKEQTTLRGYLLTKDKEILPDIDKASAQFDKTIAELNSLLESDAEEHQSLDRFAAAGQSYKTNFIDPERQLANDAATIGKAIEVVKSGKGINLIKPALDAAQEMHEVELRQIADAKADLQVAFRNARMALLIGAALSLLGAIFIGWLLSRTIAKPVVALTAAMRRLSVGDNAIAVPALGRRDEIGEMADALLIFRQNALDKIALETDAANQRRAAEEIRLQTESERAANAAEQAHVVSSVATGLAKLSSGDLTYRLETAFVPAYEKLRNDFNAAMDQLEETIAIVAETTQGICVGTDQISTASDDLSRRTEQQAANLEETAAALDQITATVQKTAAGASHAHDAVMIAQDNAVQGEDVVRNAVSAMSGIEKSSKEIAQIIGVIDEIAFQTNLLALNAGIEAARAGDAGRGFAVIATEVRALAQRSAESGKEIKTLISSSIQQVDKGVDLVGESGKVLQRIANQVTEINEIVSEMAASTKEQASGLTQVNQAINQMDQMTQQNAAMVEESTAASHSLMQETEQLVQLIHRFQVTQEVGQRPVQARSAAPAPKFQPTPAAKLKSLPTPAAKPRGQVRHDRRKAPRPPVLKALSGGPPQHSKSADEEGWSEF